MVGAGLVGRLGDIGIGAHLGLLVAWTAATLIAGAYGGLSGLIDTWDKAAVEAELKRRGHTPRPDTENSFHITDPDGFDVQISGKGMDPKLI